MRKGQAATAALLVLAQSQALAGPSCDRPQVISAVHAAALQQEMMVAAFMCRDVAAYNQFVLSHRPQLQEADRVLLSFFMEASPATGDGDYNFYKTELANNASLRSLHDQSFCDRVNANFRAAVGRSLERLLAELPFPADTGSVSCAWATSTPTATVGAMPTKSERHRHRTLLGRLVDALVR